MADTVSESLGRGGPGNRDLDWSKHRLSQEEPRHFKDKNLEISTLFIGSCFCATVSLMRNCVPDRTRIYTIYLPALS